ncbi:MAG: flagellar protein FlgN [Sphingomonas taxi]|uniref:Flagellar protein FlgN n=1 Tax=Sphingomonas taxi TaxID=1549858 RepID=A0A2W5RFI8_9SPHN|nr:MAG: flagellar protein FlgN [Sphingomonas taxi]
MKRRDALVRVIDLLHVEIAALKNNDMNALERATANKLRAIEELRALGDGPTTPELRALVEEADRLNDTCRIYVNLMAANVRRRLQLLSGQSGSAYGRGAAAAYA